MRNRLLVGFCLCLGVLKAMAADQPAEVEFRKRSDEPAPIFQATLPDFSQRSYERAIAQLIETFELSSSFKVKPGAKVKVGLKVYTNSGYGLSTPLPLLRALIELLKQRGFEAKNIYIVDASQSRLRDAKILPPLQDGGRTFEGCPVYALDEGACQHPDWFYSSPIASVQAERAPYLRRQGSGGINSLGGQLAVDFLQTEASKKSFLPVPLLFEVDFWINLPMVTDHPAIGINGAIANATLWNVTNYLRFLKHTLNSSVAAAEIAAIPELRSTLAFTILTLQTYQYIGGPAFNAYYTLSEPLLLLSPAVGPLDALMFEKINAARLQAKMKALEPPVVFKYLEALGLERTNDYQISIQDALDAL